MKSKVRDYQILLPSILSIMKENLTFNNYELYKYRDHYNLMISMWILDLDFLSLNLATV